MEMKTLMHNELLCGDEVKIILKNGDEVSGTIESMGQDLFQILLPSGIHQPMTYDIVGTYQIIRYAQPIINFEDNKVSLADLKKELKDNSPQIYQLLLPKLNSLDNAVKIKEVAAKYGRTPGILTVLINQLINVPGNLPLMGLIGEVAIMSADKKCCTDALSSYSKNWVWNCYESTNIMRLLVQLSVYADNYVVFHHLLYSCPNNHLNQIATATMYLMNLLNICVEFQIRNKPADSQMLNRLVELLDDHLLNAKGHSPSTVPEKQKITKVKLEPLQSVGTIFFYNSEQRFGQLRDEENVYYRFTLSNVEASARAELHPGTKVLFYRTTVYSSKYRRDVGAADRIKLLPENAIIEYLPQEQRLTGYIILYMHYRGNGYIISADEYGLKERGDIYFETRDIIGNAFLDTRKYHYKVTFSFADQDDDTSGPKRAKSIRIEERIPLEDAPMLQNAKSEDIDKFEMLSGETLLVRDFHDNVYLGTYVSRKDKRLILLIQNQNRTFAYWDIKELMFFGLITSYSLLNDSGMINGVYPFRSTDVISVELSHLLRQNKFSTFLCMYSLLAADNNLYINKVDYLSDIISKQIPWKSGKIQGDYQAKHYLTVQDNIRCYISCVKDSTLLNQFNPPETMDFMLQDAFYKAVTHKAPESASENGKLIQSILDIRVMYHLGKVFAPPTNPTYKKIQSGSNTYTCDQDLSSCENGTPVKIKLKLSENNQLVADYFDSQDLNLPVFYRSDTQMDMSSQSQAYEDDVFDPNLQLSNIKVMTLLEFSRDSFDYGHIRGYLPDNYARMFRDGRFTGNLTDGKKLIELLSDYKSAGKKMSKKESWVEKIPKEIQPELILAAARIHHQLCSENNSDDFFSEKKNTQILVNYAWHHLTTGLVTEPAEVEYFSEIIFLNDFHAKNKNQMLARCLAEYFTGMKNAKLASFGDRNAIIAIFRRECNNVPGLTEMLMNLPQDTFHDLLNCAKTLKHHGLLSDIATNVSGGNLENHAYEYAAESCTETIRTYYQAFNQQKAQLALRISRKIAINDVPVLLEQIEEAEQGLGRYLFNNDRTKLERIRKIVNSISDALMNEDVVTQTAQLETIFGQLRNIVTDIESHPSKFSFEVLRSFVKNLQHTLVEHLNQRYELYQPKLRIEHYSISGDIRRETFCVSNAANCLSAYNIRVGAVSPYGDNPGFVVDLEGNRQITGEGKSVIGGKGVEISVPINMIDSQQRKSFALSINLSYERNTAFDPEKSIPETETCYVQEVNLQIPLFTNDDAPLTNDDNPYRAYASGGEMKPDGKAERMFFGRQEDIEKVYDMLVDEDGVLAGGSIVAIYGQKRCGKTSVMNFLGKRIEDHFSDALVLYIDAQKVSREDAYKGLLCAICTEFRIKWRKNRILRSELKEAGLDILPPESIFKPGGEDLFNAFFSEFRAEFGARYPIVLMVDEFTMAYILMKSGKLSGDFLNRWRAMIQSNEFINVVVGQDFMEKFTTDESITRLNHGGAVNGLGTMGRKRLSYLDFESARKMMVDPIRKPDGSSRYQDILGEEAIKRIYDLTGGSAFYLMKFCNALVNYMIENNEQLISVGLVDTVADSYVFDTRDNPINKTDFDPIYNAYSYDGASDSDAIEDIDAHAQSEMNESYQMLKCIADNSNRLGICNTNSISWANTEEKYRILQTLRIRGVLCDANGAEIKSENMENTDVKIKVGLFSIWLKKRG